MRAPYLTYDNLPPGSTLLREYTDDGGIIITAPATKPDELVKSRLRRRAAIPAAWISAGVITLCLLIFGGQAYANRHILPWWTGVLALACAALLFLFVWQARFSSLLDSARVSLRQNTVLAVRNGRVLLESHGPLGQQSLDVSLAEIRRVQVIKNLARSAEGEAPPLDALVIALSDGGQRYAFVGRDALELEWVRRALMESPAR